MPTDQSVAATQFATHQAADYTVRLEFPSYGKIQISEMFIVTSCPGQMDLLINICNKYSNDYDNCSCIKYESAH